MREIEWGSCLLEPQQCPELERRFQRATGRPDRAIRYFAGVPWLEEAVISLSVQIETHVGIDADLADLAGMVVSQDNSCRYCFAATRAFLRMLGMPRARIEHLERDLLVGEFSASERAALHFARRASRSNPLPTPADVEGLRRAGFDDLQVAELAGVVGLNVFFNRLSTMCALPPQFMEELPDRWHMRLLRPIMARSLRRVRRRAAPEPLRREEREGPFSHVVVGLDGLPLARSLRSVIDGMDASPLLTRRARALVVAVVARALGCSLSEQEAARLLRTEGLDGEPLERILAHLASPVLDPVERVAVPFARETVWYQPARIQDRAREVMGALSREQFLELVAVASLANALCRLGIIVALAR